MSGPYENLQLITLLMVEKSLKTYDQVNFGVWRLNKPSTV